MNTCELILDMLARVGVRHVFGIPGDAINTLVEAVRTQDAIDFVQVRHEEAGAFAASGQSKLGRQPGVCVGTAGPGAIHLLNGLYDAAKDRVPVLAITGQVPRFQLGTSSHQEVDLNHLFDDVCVFNEVIDSSDQARELIEQALRAALSRNGVAHLNLPEDVAGADAGELVSALDVRPRTSALEASDLQLERAAQMLRSAHRPVILVGEGSRGAEGRVDELARRIGAPIIQTLRAKDLFAHDHPRCIGGLGLLGGRPAVEAMDGCDVLLMSGTDFPYEDFLPDKSHVVQIDRISSHIGRRVPVDVGLVADVEPTLRALLEMVPEQETRVDLADDGPERRLWKDWMRRREEDRNEPIHPAALARTIGEHAPRDAIFCCDTGEVTAWCARHLHLGEEHRFILSGNLASMAFALPAAIGAGCAFEKRPVVALCGDGGFSMLLGEFLTVVKYDLPVTVVVFDNGKLGLIEVEQNVAGYPKSETKLPEFDFARFAELCGGSGSRVRSHEELPAALERAFNSGRPSIVHVDIDPDALVIPPRLDWREAKGYGIARMKEFFEALSDED